MKILADENLTAALQLLPPLGDLTLVPGREITPALLENVDALLVRSVTQVDEALLKNSGVKFVGTATAGVDHIDVDYLETRNIAFVDAAGANANSVVEYVFSAIASCGSYLEQLVSGDTVGVVGYGRIGSLLATRLEALGIAFKCYDPWLDQVGIKSAASLEEVLRCRVICLHAELTHRQPWPSFHLLAEQELARLGDRQLLINACRGSVVDNTALLTRLSHNNPPDVVLDVWEGEPNLNPMLLEKVQLGSAHIAGYSYNAKYEGTAILADALGKLLGQTDNMPTSGDGSPAIAASAEEGAAFLRNLFIEGYDIALDDNLLREVVANAKNSNAIAAGFDQLRKNYRKRAELKGCLVAIDPSRKQACHWLKALGCELQGPV